MQRELVSLKYNNKAKKDKHTNICIWEQIPLLGMVNTSFTKNAGEAVMHILHLYAYNVEIISSMAECLPAMSI